MSNARVLRNFAEDVLAIDELHFAAEEPLKIKSKPIEMMILLISDALNNLFGGEVRRIAETFGNSVLSPGYKIPA